MFTPTNPYQICLRRSIRYKCTPLRKTVLKRLSEGHFSVQKSQPIVCLLLILVCLLCVYCVSIVSLLQPFPYLFDLDFPFFPKKKNPESINFRGSFFHLDNPLCYHRFVSTMPIVYYFRGRLSIVSILQTAIYLDLSLLFEVSAGHKSC